MCVSVFKISCGYCISEVMKVKKKLEILNNKHIKSTHYSMV